MQKKKTNTKNLTGSKTIQNVANNQMEDSKVMGQNSYFITWVSPFGVLVLEFSWTATYSGSLGRDNIIYAVIIIHFTVKFSELLG